MKNPCKKLLVLSCFIVFTFLSVINVKAQDGCDYKIMGISNELYNINELQIINFENTGDVFFTGKQLSSYGVNALVYKEDIKLPRHCKWENPFYVIKEGYQDVNILLTTPFDKNVTVTVQILGVKGDGKKLDYIDFSNKTITATLGNTIYDIAPENEFSYNGKVVTGSIIYSNTDILSIGNYEIRWTFTPDDLSFVPVSGIYLVNIRENIDDEQTMQSLSTSLTANTIILNQDSSYDINLVDKVSGATYEWLSSNSKIAKVDKKGIVTAVKEGKTKITCKVTTPEKQTYELTADVVVGTDDNFTILTDSELTLEIGDLYDIDVENGVKGSKYKWTTSDKSIAKVNSSNGKVTAIKVGEATIYCTITAPNKEVIVLSCKINIE